MSADINPIIAEDAATIFKRIPAVFEKLAGNRVLITGASGFLLSYLVDVFRIWNRQNGVRQIQIVALDNFITGAADRLKSGEGISLVKHDIRQPYSDSGLFSHIIHGASIASPIFYRKYPLETIDVNVNGCRHLLDLARAKNARCLFLSTSEIYGDPDPKFIPTPEDYRGFVSCTGPRAVYDESKRLGETLCVTYHSLYGTPVVTGRPFNVFGPGQKLDDQRILPDLMRAALRKEPLTLLSDGRATRTFCYAADGITALLLILVEGRPGEAYNMGSDAEEISIRALAERMKKVPGCEKLEIRFSVSEDKNYTVDNPQRRVPNLQKIRSELGYKPLISLDEGLARTFASYQS